MRSVFSRRLSGFVRLSADDEALIEQVTAQRRHVLPRDEIVPEKGQAKTITLVQSGWACRYRSMEDGRRQIVALLLPGDVCDFNVFVLNRVEYGIAALTSMELSDVSADGFDQLLMAGPRLRQGIWWAQLVSTEIQREWTVSLGRRSAFERIAHLMCETFHRLRAVGLTQRDTCAFPLTQTDIAEASGLSAVHVNRTLQELRSAELIVLRDRTLRIPDLEALEQAAAFDPGYLHLDHSGRYLDAN